MGLYSLARRVNFPCNCITSRLELYITSDNALYLDIQVQHFSMEFVLKTFHIIMHSLTIT